MSRRKVIVLTITLEEQDKASVDALATDAMLHMQSWLDADPDYRAAGAVVYMRLDDEQ